MLMLELGDRDKNYQTKSAPIPAVYAAPRLIRSIRANEYRSAKRGRIRQSTYRLNALCKIHERAKQVEISHIVFLSNSASNVSVSPFSSLIEPAIDSLEMSLVSESE